MMLPVITDYVSYENFLKDSISHHTSALLALFALKKKHDFLLGVADNAVVEHGLVRTTVLKKAEAALPITAEELGAFIFAAQFGN